MKTFYGLLERKGEETMELDRTGLESRIFDALSVTSRRRYVYVCNMQTEVSRWSKYAAEDFELPGEFF